MLIDTDGYIKITDFGLSKRNIEDSYIGASSICGTPEYLAPEVLKKQGYGQAVDWWAFGSIIFEMVTGLPPFCCSNRDFLYNKILEHELVYPKYVDKTLKPLLEGLLQKDPKKRFAWKEVQSHEWFRNIDWSLILIKKITPPFIPALKSELDVAYFDTV